MAIYRKLPTHQDEELGIQRFNDTDFFPNSYSNVVRTMVEVISDHDSYCIICEHAKERDRLIVVDFEEEQK